MTACVLVGALPARTVGPFLHMAAQSILGENFPAYSLAVWHGFNLPLVMSIVALAEAPRSTCSSFIGAAGPTRLGRSPISRTANARSTG